MTTGRVPRLLISSLIVFAGISFGQANDSSGELKRMSLEELMRLEVTSVSRQPEPYRQAPAAIQVITREEIHRSGASTIPEALRLADNLIVTQKHSSAWAISARGFNTDLANKLLVLIDGRTVYTPLFSGVFWDRQDYLLEDIERIEVISGPGGTLWGANAVNGVINIITRNAKDSQGLYAEAGGGTQLQDFAGVRYGGTIASRVFFRVFGKYFDRDNEFFPNGSAASDSWRKGEGGFRMDFEKSLHNNFTLQGDVYDGDEHLSAVGRSRSTGGNVLGRWSHAASDDSGFNLQLYYDRTHLRIPVPATAFAPAGALEDDLDTYDIDFQHRFPLGARNHIVWGMGYRFTHDEVKNAPALAFVPPTLNRNLYSAFVQNEIRLAEELAVTVGAKIEDNDYTGAEIQPNVRLRWDVTSQQMLWGAVSRAVRAPSRVDRDERLPTPALAPAITNLLIGGANFASETVIAYETGYRAQLSSKVSGSLSLFYNDYADVRSTSMSSGKPFGLPLFFENNLEGETHGFELSANYQALEWWRLHGAYNLLNEHLHVKPGQRDVNNALNETADPQHQASLRSSMNLPLNLELDGSGRWVSPLRFNTSGKPGRVPSYSEMDARLDWHPTENLELSVIGQSLLHDHHLEYVISGSNPREEIGRSVYGKIAVRW